MHTSSLLVAALAAASALAVEDRPRIYFPRQVKRQFLNASITSHRPHPPPEPTPGETTTKRQTSLLDFFPSDPFGHGFSTSTGSSGSKPGSTGSSGNSGSGVTTVVIASTVVVSPGGTPTDTPADSSSSDSSNGVIASSGVLPPIIVLPTLSLGLGLGSGTTSSANSTETASTDPTSSNSEILLAPTGIVTSSTSTPGLLAPIESLVSSVVSQVTTIIDPTPTTPNVTASNPAVETTPPPTTTPPLIDISLTIPPVLDPTTTPNVTISTTTPPPDTTTPPPDTTPPPPPPPPTSNTTTYPPTTSAPNTTDVTTPPPDTTPPTTYPPTSLPTTLPPEPTNTNSSLTNTTAPPTPTPTPSDSVPLTSLPPTATITNSQSWLPTTMIQQPSLTSPNPTGLAPTTATGLPTGLPKAITPDTANGPIPDDTVEIQMGFLYGLNYPFVASNPKSAAQVLNTMPGLLEYQGGFGPGKVFVRRLLPLDTSNQLGYVTMLCILTYPTALFDQLRLDMRLPAAALWNNPNELAYNMSLQINSAIDITIGSTLDWNPDGAPGSPGSTSVSNPNDVFNQGDGSSQSPQQKGIVASVAVGAVVVAGAYGAAMFIIARRYKKKKQSHHRSSSVTNPSTMRQTGSPALMGGALLSRDFTSNYGGVAGGRDSHNSHGSHGTQGSGMNNSGRTAYISAPVAAENSLGWN